MARYLGALFVLSLMSIMSVLFLDLSGLYFNRRSNPFDGASRASAVSDEEISQWREMAYREKQVENSKTDTSRWTSFHNIYQLGDEYDGQQNAYVAQNDGGNVFLFSVVAMNTTVSKHWDFIVVNAWETRKLKDESFICCFMYKGKTRQVNVAKKLSYKSNLGTDPDTAQGRQYMCKNPLNGKNSDMPKGVTVVRANKKCPIERKYYLKPVLPERPPPKSFVVCAKAVFDRANANNLIEWLEYQRYFGVTKVVVYLSYDTIEEAKRVLEHYSKEDFVEVIPVGKLPKLDQKRDWATKTNFANVAQDTAVILYDFQARCHSYTFGAVIDPDEFVLMKDGSETFVQFMNNIMRTDGLSNMAVAKMIPEFHITEWGVSNSSIPMTLAAYNHHTAPMRMSPKNFYVTSRVVHGAIATHNVIPKEEYISVEVDPKAAVLRHFRNCNGKFKNKSYDSCIKGKGRILDTEITRIASAIYPHVQRVRDVLRIEFPVA